jgi:aminoglycoside phosphotransferase (APT) family kinase protein
MAGFCDRHGIGSGPTRVERLGDGHSNLTYLVERDRARVVLRRPPPPPLPPSAHDMVRESGIVDALHRAGARVPQVLAVCRDESVIGVPFYVMTLVDGAPIDTQLPAEIADATECARLGADIVDALVEVHAIDIRAAGLDPFGRPDGYLARQVRRFLGLWDVNRTRDLPLVAEVGALLAETAPESGPATVVHGDYRVGNLLAARDAPGRVAAILDWELATIGDPLADVGYLVATWSQADDPEDALRGLSAATRAPGFPTRDELIARYEERSGRSMSDLPWYMTLALWKSAVFLEGSYKRRLAGTTEDAFFDRLETGVPLIAERAWATATG